MTLLELLQLLKKHLRLVVLMPVICAIVMLLYSFIFMGDSYTATTSMYVLAQSDDSTSQALSSDLSASQMLTNDVATLLTSDRVTKDTADALQLENLDDFEISVTSETTTRVLSCSVTGGNAEAVVSVANELAANVSDVAQEVMNVESVNVIDEAEVPDAPSGPNRMLYIAVAFMAGLFGAVAIVVIVDMLDTRVRSAEEVEELLGIPVIGRIPEMKGGR